jgi:hypothetical protein
MLRTRLYSPTRLAFGGVLRSSAVLRVAPTAADSARLVARPLASLFCRFSGFTSLRALSTVATPIASAANKSDDDAEHAKSAAELRVLDVLGVVDFVKKQLKIDPDECKKLVKQKIDGAALLETSVDELRSYGLSGGAAHALMRGIAPAVAEVRAAAALAAVEAQSVTLTIFPPTDKKKNNPYKTTLTPDLFQRTFSPQTPLRLLNSSGSFLRIVTSLAEAVEASQKKGMFLHASRSYDDDLVSLNGFVTNSAMALEIKSTLALASNEHLRAVYGQLELVNEGQVVELKLSREGEKTLKLAPDGLVVCLQSSVVLFNSAKHTPSEAHLVKMLENVTTLEAMLADWANVATDPIEAKAQLRGGLRVVPFLSGDNFNAAVAAKCLMQGIGIVRPSDEGFIVKAAELLAPVFRLLHGGPPSRST